MTLATHPAWIDARPPFYRLVSDAGLDYRATCDVALDRYGRRGSELTESEQDELLQYLRSPLGLAHYTHTLSLRSLLAAQVSALPKSHLRAARQLGLVTAPSRMTCREMVALLTQPLTPQTESTP